MNLFRNLYSLFIVVIKRLTKHLGLTLCIIAGLTVAIALATGIPIYSEAVNMKMIREELNDYRHSPFTFIVTHTGSTKGLLEWEEYETVNDYTNKNLPKNIQLPQIRSVRYAKTDTMRLMPMEESVYEESSKPLKWISMAFLTDYEDKVEIIEGRLPEVKPVHKDFIDVLISQELAEEVGLHAGETYYVFSEETAKNTGIKTQITIPVYVAGIWKAKQEKSPYWVYHPGAFTNSLLIPEQSFIENIDPRLKEDVYFAFWSFVFDGENLHVEDISDFLSRLTHFKTQITSRFDGPYLSTSPEPSLRNYLKESFHLTILLYVFSIPIFGLVLYFISLIANMMVEKQRGEIALLRSRGTSHMQILGIYLFEYFLVGAISVAFGLLLGKVLAQLMINTQSLLQFDWSTTIPTRISRTSVWYALAGLLLVLIMVLIPVRSASTHTIITYKRERSRSSKKPFWQRIGLDFFLLAILAYGYYNLSRRGSISLFMQGEAIGNPFHNPLLFLLPSLSMFTLALIFLRFFPMLMESLAKLSEAHRGVSIVLALRSLARSTGHYAGPLILVVLTVGLISFTASMARTMDNHLVDKVYYESGSDINLRESGNYVEAAEEESGNGGGTAFSGGGSATDEANSEAHWEFLPVFDYLNIPEVKSVARVGSYEVRANWSETGDELFILGVDGEELAETGFFRDDFSGYSLEKLMKTLENNNRAILVDRRFFKRNKLEIGNEINLNVRMRGKYINIEFLVAGVVDYFPTAYPEDGQFFVADLEYLFSQAGGLYYYDVWVKTESDVSTDFFKNQLRKYGLTGDLELNAPDEIERQKLTPERQGFFGLLSVGFLASAFLTAIGFFIYTLLYFQERSIEFGVLRAIGLSVRQMIAYLVGEQLSLVSIGVSLGVFLGSITSYLFIPFLQVGANKYAHTPPFVVQIAWWDILKIIILYGAVLLLLIVVMIWFLRHLKIFRAVKLEEVM